MLAVMHLLRVRPREVRVVTTLFWAQAVERSRARTLLRRFRHPWTYALLLLICALLSLALAEPRLTGQAGDRLSAVIVVDAGASMSAAETTAGETRFDAARQAALAEAGKLALSDRLAIVVADPLPRVVHRFDDPRPLIERRLAEAAPAALPAARGEALRLAVSMLRDAGDSRVVLITDRRFDPPTMPADDEPANVQVVYVGEPAANAAILWAGFVADPVSPLRGRFLVRVGRWALEPAEVRIEIQRAGGAPLLSEAALLGPGDTHDFAVPDLPADGDRLLVRIESGDTVRADDVAVFRLPLRRPALVALDDAVPLALRTALRTDPSVEIAKPGEPRDMDVIMGSGAMPPERPSIVVASAGPPLTTGNPVVPLGSSPLVRSLDFAGASCGAGVSLARGDGSGTPLLGAGKAVLAALSDVEGMPCLVVSPALLADGAEVSGRAAFAVFMARALRLLAGWQDGPVVLTAERTVADPLWDQRAGHAGQVATMPASRLSGELLQPVPAQPAGVVESRRRWSAPALFEVILSVAVALWLLEAVLHARGRIS